jgi:hypothetical protein
MTTLEWIAQGSLLALMAAAMPFIWRLDRRLIALRAEGAALGQGAAEMAEATVAAEAALARLRATAEASGRAVAERVATGERLRDDLAFLTERAEALADRLDTLVRSGRPLAQPDPGPRSAPAPATPRSEAERELQRALRGTG